MLTQGSLEGAKQHLRKSESTFVQLKRVIKQYGTVATVFHTLISMVSLGIFYMIVNM